MTTARQEVHWKIYLYSTPIFSSWPLFQQIFVFYKHDLLTAVSFVTSILETVMCRLAILAKTAFRLKLMLQLFKLLYEIFEILWQLTVLLFWTVLFHKKILLVIYVHVSHPKLSSRKILCSFNLVIKGPFVPSVL